MKGLVEEVPQARAADHDPGHGRADACRTTRTWCTCSTARTRRARRKVTAKSLLEACLRMKPDRIFLAEVRGDECFSLRAAGGLGPPGQHHQRARRQLRAGLRADGADDPRERRRRRPAHERDQVAARRRRRRRRAVRPRRARALHLRDLLRAAAAAPRPLGRRGAGSAHEQRRVAADRRAGRPGARSPPASFALARLRGAGLRGAVPVGGAVPAAEQGRPAPGAVHQHRRTTGTLYADDAAAAQEAARLDRRRPASACWSCCPARCSPRHGRAGRCTATPGSRTRPRSRAPACSSGAKPVGPEHPDRPLPRHASSPCPASCR